MEACGESRALSRTAKWTLTLLVLALMGFMIWNSMARVRRSCEVCVVFKGRRNCARAAGGDEQEARRGAQTTACGPLASGMDETIRCENAQPVAAACSTN